MRKIYPKLIAMGFLLSLSVSVVAMASYAWMVLSSSPVVSGIQVAIGGGNTILVAPDLTAQGENGEIYHYPGRFSDKMNFRQHAGYDYLRSIGTLMPVSTVNGVDWFMPVYYNSSDEEVAQGIAMSGQLKPFDQFKVDSELAHANLTAKDKDKMQAGHYAYLDFWVVSPSADFTLRLSTGDDSGGTFVIDLLEPVKNGSGYTLAYPAGTASSTVRVGFLANPYRLTDKTMETYVASPAFDERFISLRGMYAEPNTGTSYLADDKFVIYEPNGNSHPHDSDLDGAYVRTDPLGYRDGKVEAMSVQDRLTAQNSSVWKPGAGSNYGLEERFQAAILNQDISRLEADEISDLFYNRYLQGQIYPFIDKARFYADTDNLYVYMGDDGILTGAELQSNLAPLGTVTPDVTIIDLERNVPQRIRMFIWLEGQDVDCVDMVSKCAFAVNIELAGGNE